MNQLSAPQHCPLIHMLVGLSLTPLIFIIAIALSTSARRGIVHSITRVTWWSEQQNFFRMWTSARWIYQPWIFTIIKLSKLLLPLVTAITNVLGGLLGSFLSPLNFHYYQTIQIAPASCNCNYKCSPLWHGHYLCCSVPNLSHKEIQSLHHWASTILNLYRLFPLYFWN